jgi:large subunit ribosomal protein L47
LKSHDDLHKLWYVLLKEKNKLKSDLLLSQQLGQQFYGFSELLKVRLSMSRLLTIVNERKKLRNEYRRHLEDEYIERQKKAEQESINAEGKEKVLNEEEVKELLIKRSAKKQEALKIALEQIEDSA